MNRNTIGKKLTGAALCASLAITAALPAHASINQTMLALCSELSAGSNENVVISPYSIRMALSMLAEGAKGTSKEELDAFLENYAELLDLSEETTLEIANSFWTNKGFIPSEEYITLLQEKYNALSKSIDFTASDAPAQINGWVSDKTHGLITELVDASIANMDAVLINALYYLGTWQTPYEGGAIKEKTFHAKDGDQTASMLTGNDDGWVYFENEQAAGFKLYYEDGLQFISILPHDEDFDMANLDLDAFLKSNDDWCTKNVSLYYELPEFKTTFDGSLKNVLSTLGINDVFTGKADLSGIASGLAVSDVIHKTYIDVNRKGTEAAAVTGIVMEAMAMPPEEEEEPIYKEVILDRPFAFAIVEPMSGELLFLGEINSIS